MPEVQITKPEPFWTVENVDRLIERHAAGLTHGEIANEFGVTRNKICGKVARLNLPARNPRLNDSQRQQAKIDRLAKDREKQLRRRLRAKGPVMALTIAKFQGSLEIPYKNLKSFTNKGSNQCRYVAAEPGGPDYLACGNPTDEGQSYCNHHRAIVYHRPVSLSDAERARRIVQGIQNCKTAGVKRASSSEAQA